MSEPRDDHDETRGGDEGSAAMRALLKRSLGGPSGGEPPAPDLLRGVQTKLRRRSRGKFYADGWSTAQSRINYVTVAVVMLVLVAVVWLALGPVGFAR